jgi:hypothetical protein
LSAKDLFVIISAMPTTAQLKKAVIISEKLDALEAELAAILGGSSKPAKAAKEPKAPKARGPGRPKKTKRVMSEEGRKRIAEAQKKRWAAQKKAAK